MDEFDFEELKSKLNEISATLLQILDEQRRSNIAIENIGDEISFSNERICRDLSEVNVDGFGDNAVLFLGFRKKDVKQFVSEYAARTNKPYKYIAAIESMGDFASIVTSCEEGTVLLINCAGIDKSQETLSGITDAIGDGFFTTHIGKGGSAQQVNLDMPKMNYIFFETSCFNLPRTLRDGIDLCIWNEADKKRD